MKTKSRPRGELIELWRSGALTAAGGPPPPTGDAPTPPPAGADESDAAVTEAISSMRDAVAKAIDLQKADPDTDDPIDAKVLSQLQQVSDLIDAVATTQDADNADREAKETTPDGAPPPPKAAPAPSAPGAPPAAPAASSAASMAGQAPAPRTPDATPESPPGDSSNPSGDVAPDVQCTDPACGHMASAHEDTIEGQNTGHCTMQNCECMAMQQPPDAVSVDGPPSAAPGTPPVLPAKAAASMADTPETTPTDGIDAPTAPAPVPVDSGPTGVVMPGGDDDSSGGDSASGTQMGGPGDTGSDDSLMGPAFTIPVLVIEGIETSDGRMIAPDALTWRNPPLPLMGLDQTSEGHDKAIICGRIDSITRNDDGTLSAAGFFLANDDGLNFAQLVATQAIKGVSVDIGNVTSAVSVTGEDEMGFPTDVAELLTAGEIMGATICPMPAFAGAYIVLGDGSDGPAPIPMQQPTVEQAALGIHVLSVSECEPCASGRGLVASIAPTAPPRAWFDDPQLDELTPVQVTDSGRVFGHIAPWGECHIGIQGQCVLAPRSTSGYAYFHQGALVTAEGDVVEVGPITMDGTHASESGRLSAAQARAHYDNTASRFADVRMGEDEHGIWIAGALDPARTEEDVRRFRASAVSGDWRRIGRGMELVAALAVNTPGFPIVKAIRASGELVALIAAGAPTMARLSRSRLDPGPEPIEARLARIERTQSVLGPIAKDALRSRFAATRGR